MTFCSNFPVYLSIFESYFQMSWENVDSIKAEVLQKRFFMCRGYIDGFLFDHRYGVNLLSRSMIVLTEQ